MCAALLNVEQATTEEIKMAVDRKFTKFGSAERMPMETRKLVAQGLAELTRREQSDSATKY